MSTIERLSWHLYTPMDRWDSEVNPDKCAASVMQGYRSYQCLRSPKVELAGHRWCKQHADKLIRLGALEGEAEHGAL